MFDTRLFRQPWQHVPFVADAVLFLVQFWPIMVILQNLHQRRLLMLSSCQPPSQSWNETSFHGNVFRITDSLWGNPSVSCGPPHKGPVMRIFDFDASMLMWRHYNEWTDSWTIPGSRKYCAWQLYVYINYRGHERDFFTLFTVLGEVKQYNRKWEHVWYS